MMNKRVIYVESTDVEVERQILKGLAKVECLKLSQSSPQDEMSNADVIAVWHGVEVSKSTIKCFKKAKCIIQMGADIDNIDIETASAMGIPICNIPDYGTEEIADRTLSHILNCYQGTFSFGNDGPEVTRVKDSVLGIVGFGKVAAAVATRAKTFGFDVVFYDPYTIDPVEKMYGIRRARTFRELIKQSKCVTMHCNATQMTNKMINETTLEYFHDGAFLVNTSSRQLVDEDALTKALKNGQLGMAVMDVTWEDFVNEEGDLGDVPNLMCIPQSASFSNQTRLEMRLKVADTVRKALLGEPLVNVVNEHLLPNARTRALKRSEYHTELNPSKRQKCPLGKGNQ